VPLHPRRCLPGLTPPKRCPGYCLVCSLLFSIQNRKRSAELYKHSYVSRNLRGFRCC
ncbi:hypothetical protein X975_23493, partial [Stegodyphus mimosarum]